MGSPPLYAFEWIIDNGLTIEEFYPSKEYDYCYQPRKL